MYLFRTTYEDFDVETDYAIILHSTVTSGSLVAGVILTGRTSGATAEITAFTPDPSDPNYEVFVLAGVGTPLGFTDGEVMDGDNGCVVTMNTSETTFNFKPVRFYPDGTITHTLLTNYQGVESNEMRITPENTAPTIWPNDFTDNILYQKPEVWKTEEFDYVTSDIDVSNGLLSPYVNGQLGTTTPIRMRTSPTHESQFVYVYHSQVSHRAQPESYMYYDNLYINDERNRVILSNQSSWNHQSESNKAIQIPITWVDKKVMVSLDKGMFAAYTGLYIYVIDINGNPASYYGALIDDAVIG